MCDANTGSRRKASGSECPGSRVRGCWLLGMSETRVGLGAALLQIDFYVSYLAHGQAEASLEGVKKILAKARIGSHNKPLPLIRVENDALHTGGCRERRTIADVVYHSGFGKRLDDDVCM